MKSYTCIYLRYTGRHLKGGPPGGKPSPGEVVINHGNPATVHHQAQVTLTSSGNLRYFIPLSEGQ